ncbi:LysR family transcriptional regulator [Capillimicrobium parvum]|uniref:HTH-type transcriptional regulator HdfR n=1 Tax=Capillimicrobium parvum TaxID=2884022 RepID=A0A9E6Y4K6_9ACTN|nr:LysR family transcriptional regulator [Capillimicrobium parvum]UGS38901.1 HTH-type transcriptional regulator HdfR [Capillimicrobium parvum]
MTLQQLQYFLASVEHGSFSAAAEALHLAQPSVSEQVRRLEDELGVTLFQRVGRGLVATEAGRTLRPHAERVLAEVEGARDAVVDVREVRGGTAAFGVFGTSRYYLGADLVRAFHRDHPDVRIQLVGQNSSEVVDAVRAGELEAGVVVLPIDDAGLDVRPAMRDELLFCSADPAHLRSAMTIERLARGPLVLYDVTFGAQDPTRRQLTELAQRAGVTLEPLIDVEDPETALDLAVEGLGDTIAARGTLLAQRRRLSGRLGWVPFAEPIYDDFAFVWRRGAHLSPATRAFVQAVEERLASVRRRLDRVPRRHRPGA